MGMKLGNGEMVYRHLRGPNVMKLIGFGLNERNWPDKLLEHMAGNAFNGPQLSAVLTAVAVAFGT